MLRAILIFADPPAEPALVPSACGASFLLAVISYAQFRLLTLHLPIERVNGVHA